MLSKGSCLFKTFSKRENDFWFWDFFFFCFFVTFSFLGGCHCFFCRQHVRTFSLRKNSEIFLNIHKTQRSLQIDTRRQQKTVTANLIWKKIKRSISKCFKWRSKFQINRQKCSVGILFCQIKIKVSIIWEFYKIEIHLLMLEKNKQFQTM